MKVTGQQIIDAIISSNAIETDGEVIIWQEDAVKRIEQTLNLQHETSTNNLVILLQEAKREIKRLRQQNEVMQAKIEVMDLFACLLHTQPASKHQVMSSDVAWKLTEEIDRLKSEHLPNQEQDFASAMSDAMRTAP